MGEMTLYKTDPSVEAILQEELAREARALSGVAPVISHMLAGERQALVSDAIVARLQGMLNSLGSQLLNLDRQTAQSNGLFDAIVEALVQEGALLDHLYAVAVEGQLSERFAQKWSIDPVLSPLLQELIASDNSGIAELAMSSLAAQSRFLQSQRRMQHPVSELPSDLFAKALRALERVAPDEAAKATTALKASFDEGAGRLGLLSRLVSSMHGGAVAALELEHAGLSLFSSALASLTKQSREHAVLSCHENQSARLALGLRAAGMSEDFINRQFALVGPEQFAKDQLSRLSQDRAREILSAGGSL